jgi:alpha-galactosidase
MPGGSSRALRMIPPMVDIARDSLELCPAALLFNYGNPMACVCRAIRKATGANVVGLCHGVFDVGRHLAEALDVSPERLRYVAAGMNHLTWFTELRVDGQDAMPRLKQIARERLSRFTPGQFDDSVNPFTWQMVELFGAFPAVLDRHVTEFFGRLFSGRGAYYGKTLGLDAYSFDRTIAWGDRIFAEMREQAGRSAPLGAESLRGEHEQVIDIIESIRTDAGRCYSANLPNRGQAPNLPAEAVLESPAIADGSGLRPVVLPAMASGLAGTLATRLQWVETVVEAALEGSRDKFIQALLLDGAVDSVDVACRLADELLAAQAQYLPQFKR